MKYLHVLNIFENHCDNAHIIKSFFLAIFFWDTIDPSKHQKTPPPPNKKHNQNKTQNKKKQILNRLLHFAWVTLNVYWVLECEGGQPLMIQTYYHFALYLHSEWYNNVS